MPDEEELERFGEAVERKKQEAKAASEEAGGEKPGESAVEGDQESIAEPGRPPGVASPRDKGSRKGKVTADKWNQ
jgi:hypothetical protein